MLINLESTDLSQSTVEADVSRGVEPKQKRHVLFLFCQMVPWTLVRQGGREAAHREREEWQLPGEREPEPSWGFCSVSPYRR